LRGDWWEMPNFSLKRLGVGAVASSSRLRVQGGARDPRSPATSACLSQRLMEKQWVSGRMRRRGRGGVTVGMEIAAAPASAARTPTMWRCGAASSPSTARPTRWVRPALSVDVCSALLALGTARGLEQRTLFVAFNKQRGGILSGPARWTPDA